MNRNQQVPSAFSVHVRNQDEDHGGENTVIYVLVDEFVEVKPGVVFGDLDVGDDFVAGVPQHVTEDGLYQ